MKKTIAEERKFEEDRREFLLFTGQPRRHTKTLSQK